MSDKELIEQAKRIMEYFDIVPSFIHENYLYGQLKSVQDKNHNTGESLLPKRYGWKTN